MPAVADFQIVEELERQAVHRPKPPLALRSVNVRNAIET
jgi:hypothetical protein